LYYQSSLKSLLVLGFIEITYYPFGMISRSVFTSSLGLGYRYGFNGKENDADVKGDGDQIDYGARVYDPRLGRFMSVDPKTLKFPDLNPYHNSGNSPIWLIDKEGQEPDRNQAGTIDEAATQWSTKFKNPTSKDILNYIQKDPNAVRYIYTKDKGWIDLQHYFGTLVYGKEGMDIIEPASGSEILQDVVFGPGANESYYSYEDLPSNAFASEGNHRTNKEVETTGRFGGKVKRNVYVDKLGKELIESVKTHIKSAGATNPEDAPNWNKIPFKDHGERKRLPEIKGYKKSWITIGIPGANTMVETSVPIFFTEEEKKKLLQSGIYIPQNHTGKPFDLQNFAPAPSSLQKGDKQKGNTGH
jgi:RHS repeat-associated protein